MPPGRLTLAVLTLSLALAAPASAATWTATVTTDTAPGTGSCTPASCSLRQAVEASADGDTVLVPASATHYVLTNGQLAIQNKAISIDGAGQAQSVIEGQTANTRVMVISGNASPVRIQDLTVTGGQQTTGTGAGGGIAAGGPGPVVLSHVTVTGNTASPANSGGRNFGGGGVWSSGPLTIAHSTISNNTVTIANSGGDGGGGGIMQTAGNLTITDSTIANNTVTVTQSSSSGLENNGGGGIYMDGKDLTITRSVIRGNTTTATNHIISTPADGGGGIYQFGENLLLRDSTVSGNTANGPAHDGTVDKTGGGGIFDDGDTSQYLNSTIAQNTTNEHVSDDGSGGGGGILFDGVHGGVVMANMTVTGNTAPAGAGGGLNSFFPSTTVEITNSVVAANTAASLANCAGPMRSRGYNLADDTIANSCALTGSGDVLTGSPGLGSLQDNGGPVPTVALNAGSPAIDAGDPAGCTDLAGAAIATDARGVARPQPAGGRCDIGAFEWAPPAATTGAAAVTATAATLNGTASNPDAQSGTVSFQYGATTAYGQSTTAQALPAGATSTSYSASLSGLAPGTYHFRIVATNAAGSAAGADGVLVVSPASIPPAGAAPAVTAGSVSGIGARTATISGLVNPEAQATTVHFEYGPTTAFGMRTPDHVLPAGAAAVPVTTALTGLAPGQAYVFRLVATNATGTTAATGAGFRTLKAAARRLTAVARPRHDARAPYAFTVSGRLLLPAGVLAPAGCRGRVTIRAARGRLGLGSKKTSLTSACRYRVRVRLKAGLSPGKLTLRARFGGNAVLKARGARAVSVRVG